MRAAVTGSLIGRLRADPGKHVEVWDTKVVGLVLRLRGPGRAVWVDRARTADGKRATAKVGDHRVLRAADAGRPALVALATIQQGRDPLVERRGRLVGLRPWR
ncbi:integrase arm-type DNA-binding domain-containing protein [Dankookia sp. GCM10030260]|uniref:integrase arm-type DNA-binding domain-containing protein n=1 Tax=Dankookia sp. GCM10030260 TaxID=3273390 RepID=UPI00361E4509